MNKDCKGSLTRKLESQNPETKAEFEYDHAPDPQWKYFTCAVPCYAENLGIRQF